MIRRIRLTALLLLLTVTAPAFAQPANPADQAYQDLVTRFWSGGRDTGSWVVDDPVWGHFALWEHSGAANAAYSYWLSTGTFAADAAARIAAEWIYARTTFGAAGLTTCGTGTAANFALDDTSSNILLMLETYVVTADPLALTYAKGAIDCAAIRWRDGGAAGCLRGSTPVGGLWYSDLCAQKTVVGEYFAFVAYWYYQLSGDARYLTMATALDQFSFKNLQRHPGQSGSMPVATVTSPCPSGPPYIDGLYWNEIVPAGTVSGGNTPCQIAERGSATSLTYNLAAEILLTRMLVDPNVPDASKPLILARLVRTAHGIAAFETGCGAGGLQSSPPGCRCSPKKNGILIQDRDPHGQSIFVLNYMMETYPLIKSEDGVLSSHNVALSGRIALNADRFANRTFGGSWSGPANSDNCWGLAEDLSVSASAVNLIIAGYYASIH